MAEDPQVEYEPLGVKCTDSDCERGLHCFRQKQKRKERAAGRDGRCRACGVELIDWERVRSHDIADVEFVFASLKKEMIRHVFWHAEIDEKAVNHARRKGRRGIRAAAEHRLRKVVAPAEPAYDGRQTPKSGNVIYYAQHATASCCRTCVEQWYGLGSLQETEKSYAKGDPEPPRRVGGWHPQ